MALLWFFLWTGVASAHGPFDTSGRITLREDSLELMIVMGHDAAEKFLQNGPEALQSRGPSATSPLPVELAARLGTLSAADGVLNARSVSLHADGLEVGFIVAYPRPSGGPLEFVPGYFNGIPEMLPGGIAVTDENGNVFGAAVLSASAGKIALPFPSASSRSVDSRIDPSPVAVAVPQASEIKADPKLAAPAAAAGQPSPPVPYLRRRFIPFIGILVIAVPAVAVLRRRVKRTFSIEQSGRE